jgi:tetratricopeptide (TPR) repeat protein
MAQTTKKAPTHSGSKKKISDGELLLSKIQYSFEKNQKVFIGVVVAVLVIVGGYFGYKSLILAPKEEKAANALFPAQRWFEMDSLTYVLNGNGIQNGALSVIKKYSGTKAANLAHYYAGMSYLKTGDPANAIKQLSEFNGKNTPIEYIAYGAMGDAYLDSKNPEKGIEYYKKAAANETDNFTSPLYLFRAALASEVNGKTEEAKKLYREIKEKYPYSHQAQDIDKYLARLNDVAL